MMDISLNLQSKRIAEHPIQINNDGLIVFDDLETGRLRIYEYISGPIIIQQLIPRYNNCKNAVLLAEANINDKLWKDNGVFIHKITCGYGYGFLAEPVLSQILHFASFYNYRTVGISDREYDSILPHAKGALSGFKKENRVYEHCL